MVTLKTLEDGQMLVRTEDHGAAHAFVVGDGLGPNPYDLLLAGLGS